MLAASDLVAAFRFDPADKGAILGLLTPLAAAGLGVAAILNFHESRKQNARVARQFHTVEERAEKQLDLQRRGQMADRFTAAIGQLGEQDKLDVRIGAVYALEQIAKDSDDLHWPVMQVLTAYLREHSFRQRSLRLTESSAEFHAVSDVLRRRRWECDPVAQVVITGREWKEPLSLKGVDLRGADLHDAFFERTYFEGAQLEHSDLSGARLEQANFADAKMWAANLNGALLQAADFDGSDLTRADFGAAKLAGASFNGAQMEGANFVGADLRAVTFTRVKLSNVDFRAAQLERAHFVEVDLTQAENLTQEQIDTATCEDVEFPGSIRRPLASSDPGQ